MHRVHAPRGAQRVRELAAHLRDLPDGHERGHSEQGEQWEDGAVESARPGEHRAHADDGEPAEPGGDLLQRGLHGQVVEERHARPEVRLRLGRELHASRLKFLE